MCSDTMREFKSVWKLRKLKKVIEKKTFISKLLQNEIIKIQEKLLFYIFI